MRRGRKTVNSAVPMSRHAESWWHQGPWSWVRELAAVAVAIVYATPIIAFLRHSIIAGKTFMVSSGIQKDRANRRVSLHAVSAARDCNVTSPAALRGHGLHLLAGLASESSWRL